MSVHKRIPAGRRRHKVTFQAAFDETSYGTLGEAPTVSTAAATNVPALVEYLRGEEREQVNQICPGATHRLTCVYVSGLTTKHKVSHRGRTLQIMNIENVDDQDAELVITCGEAK